MKLFEIDAEIRTLLDSIEIDEETGEVKGDFERLSQMQEEAKTKMESIACYLKEQEAEAKSIKEVADGLTKRLKSKEKKAEALSRYLSNYTASFFASTGTKAFETDKVKLSFRTSKPLEIIDDAAALAEAKEKGLTKVKEEIDKTAIKEWLNNGKVFVSAAIVERQNLQIK